MDAIEAGVPYVTLPSEYLRGRMGQTYYRTMNIPELVAKNRSDYVAIAIKLIRNIEFKKSVVDKIIVRRHLVWEDMEVPFGWTQFLARMTGSTIMDWNTFISTTGE